MAQGGRQRGEWSKHEPPSGHPGMRNREARFVDHGVTIEQDIQVHGARRPRRMARGTTQSPLDLLQMVKQFARRKARGYFGDGIQEKATFDTFLWLGFIKRGEARHSSVGQEAQPAQSRSTVLQAIPQVGADADERLDFHGRVISTDTPPNIPGIGGDGFVARTVTCWTENFSRMTEATRSAKASRS